MTAACDGPGGMSGWPSCELRLAATSSGPDAVYQKAQGPLGLLSTVHCPSGPAVGRGSLGACVWLVDQVLRVLLGDATLTGQNAVQVSHEK